MTPQAAADENAAAAAPAVCIYEGSFLTVKAPIDSGDVARVEEVTFTFLKDGEAFDEQVLPVAQADTVAGGAVVVTYTLQAPVVPDEADSTALECRFAYTFKNSDGASETSEECTVQTFEVLPQTARLAVTHSDDDTPFPNFGFRVFHDDESFGPLRHTFAAEVKNAKDEAVPVGSSEFELGLRPGFRIVQQSGFEITEEVASTGRRREAKGKLVFKAVFLAPREGRVCQLVNHAIRAHGQTGEGHEVLIEVGVDPDWLVPLGDRAPEAHFRVTFGPGADGAVAKSARADPDHPTLVCKARDDDEDVTIEEKTANTLYQGSITLTHGRGRLVVALGKAGGDTCTVEISGSEKFLTDDAVSPDQTLEFENWRRIHYELLVPDVMRDRLDEIHDRIERFEALAESLFIELVYHCIRMFPAAARADRGTLLPAGFLVPPDAGEPVAASADEERADDLATPTGSAAGSSAAPDESEAADDEQKLVYILSGRNWRELPKYETWEEPEPGQTLLIALCDALLKWRTDTDDPQEAPTEYSGSLTVAEGVVDMQESFQGLFLPCSGFDGDDSVTDIVWTADISKDDAVCKYTPALEIDETRPEGGQAGGPTEVLHVILKSDSRLPAGAERVRFERVAEPEDANGFVTSLDDAQTAQLQRFVDALLADCHRLIAVEAKVAVTLACPTDSGSGEDDCVEAVKGKLTKLFDASKESYVFHPGLDRAGEPRTGTFWQGEITDLAGSTVREWRVVLPARHPDGKPVPSAFIGPEKTAEQCPIAIELNVRPHEASVGEADGRRLAWVYDETLGGAALMRLVLLAYQASEDEHCLGHGHGAEGAPGDCLLDGETLCDACVEHGRSLDLAALE